jgi:Tfp pilus assembly protein PilF
MRSCRRRSSSWLGVFLVLSGAIPAPAAVSATAAPDSRRIERVEAKANVVEGSGRWALVVGVDKYTSKDITPLGGAVADAKAISAALVKYAGFPQSQVFTLTTDSPAKPTAEAVLQKLADLKSSVKPDDLVLFFFAGHGVEVEGQRFLLTQDAKISSSAALKLSSLAVNMLMQEIENLPLAHRIVMVDACRDDPMSRSKRNIASEAFATAFILRPGGERGVRATFLSCKSGQTAYEWSEKGRGFFSYFIEKGLQGEAAQFGKVTVSSLETYLNEMVPQAVREQKGKEQTPFVDRSGEALVLVAADKIAPAPAAATAAPALATRRVYGIVKDSDGSPLVGANVAIAWSLGGRGASKKQDMKVVTDEDGFFSLEVPQDADAEVTAQAPGYQGRSVTSSPKDSGGKIKLFLASKTVAPAPVATRVAAATPAPVVVTPSPAPTAAPTRVAATAKPSAKPAAATASPTVMAKATVAPTAAPAATASPAKLAEELAKASYQAFLVEDFKQAETSAQEALKIDKENPLATSVLASAIAVDGVNYKKTARIAEAEEMANRALKLDASQALAHNAKGLVLWGKGDGDAAQKSFQAAVQLDPKLGPAHSNLGFLQLQKKQLKDAERSYRAAIKASPDSAVPNNGLAQVLLEQKKAGEAARAAREAISKYELRDTYLGYFYVNLAVALYQQGKQEEALEAVARAKGLGVTSNPAYDIIAAPPKKRG